MVNLLANDRSGTMSIMTLNFGESVSQRKTKSQSVTKTKARKRRDGDSLFCENVRSSLRHLVTES